MFTGLIETTGSVITVERREGSMRIAVAALESLEGACSKGGDRRNGSVVARSRCRSRHAFAHAWIAFRGRFAVGKSQAAFQIGRAHV